MDSNALIPTFVTAFGKKILYRPEPEKALLPIVFSWLPDANKTLHRLLQSLNAFESIAVTGAGTKTYPSLSTRLQSSVVQGCPFPIAVKGVDDGQTLHPLVPPAEVPVYPGAQTVQADASVPVVPVLTVL